VRQAQRLLGEVMHQSDFKEVRQRYVRNHKFLKIHMDFFRNSSIIVQCEAFHIFKIFVAAPARSPAVTCMLRRNKDRLVDFLQTFHGKGHEDNNFMSDLHVVINLLYELG